MRGPSIRPVVWQPPKVARGDRRLKGLPRPLTVLAVNGLGPEDVLVDDRDHVYTGVEDGRILRLTPDGRRIDTIADTGGRPLGLELHPDGRLVVCDAERGLLMVDRVGGEIEVLVDPGIQDLKVCNNAAVAADGTIYFSDSSQRFPLRQWRADLFEHSGTGRLFRRTPDGELTVLLDGLHFANGVALAADESFVVVAQTGAYQLDRLWLTGDRAGTRDVLAGALPAFPDNISTGSDGLIWISMAAPRNKFLDLASRLHPIIRQAALALPDGLQPQPKRIMWARALDDTGRTVHDLWATSPDVTMATGVREHDGTVYLGSLVSRAIATMPVR